MPKKKSKKTVKKEVVKKDERPPDPTITLSEEDQKEIEKDISQGIKQSWNNSQDARDKLGRIYQYFNNEIPLTDIPHKGHSQENIPVMEIIVYHQAAKVRPEVYGRADKIWEVKGKGKDERDDPHKLRLASDIINHIARVDMKMKETATAHLRANTLEDTLIAKVTRSKETRIIKEIKDGEVVDVEETVHDGPKLEWLSALNDFIWFPLKSTSLEKTRGCFQKVELSWDDLNAVDNKRVPMYENIKDLEKEYQTILKTPKKEAQEKAAGTDTGDEADYKHQPHLCWEGIYNIDLDKDHKTERYICTFHEGKEKLIRFKPYPYFHNRIYFTPVSCFTVLNQIMGKGLGSKLLALNKAINKLFNQERDAVEYGILGAHLYKKGQFDDTQKLYPGCFLEYEDEPPTNLITDLSAIPSSDNLLRLLLEFVDRTSGMSAGAYGKESAVDPRAPASKTIALLRELADLRKDMIDNINLGMSEIAHQIMELEYQYGNPEKEYLITDERGKVFPKVIKRENFPRGRYDYLPVSTSVTGDRQLDIQVNTTLKQMYEGNKNIKMLELDKEIFTSFGKDPERFILSKEERLKKERIQLEMILKGQGLPNEQIQQKLAQFDEMMALLKDGEKPKRPLVEEPGAIGGIPRLPMGA